MKLSPKAQRFVVRAIQEFPGPGRFQHRSIERDVQGEVVPDVAVVALSALQQMAGRMSKRLEATGLDDGERAELINDLRFIRAIEGELQRGVSLREIRVNH